MPEGAEVSSQDLVEALGPDVVRIPAILVPKGAERPGYPYVYFGTTAPRKSGDMAWPAGSSRGDAGMRGPENGSGGAGGNRPVGSPPVPALAQGYSDPVRAALTALRGIQDPGTGWRALGTAWRSVPAAGAAPSAGVFQRVIPGCRRHYRPIDTG